MQDLLANPLPEDAVPPAFRSTVMSFYERRNATTAPAATATTASALAWKWDLLRVAKV